MSKGLIVRSSLLIKRAKGFKGHQVVKKLTFVKNRSKSLKSGFCVELSTRSYRINLISVRFIPYLVEHSTLVPR